MGPGRGLGNPSGFIGRERGGALKGRELPLSPPPPLFSHVGPRSLEGSQNPPSRRSWEGPAWGRRARKHPPRVRRAPVLSTDVLLLESRNYEDVVGCSVLFFGCLPDVLQPVTRGAGFLDPRCRVPLKSVLFKPAVIEGRVGEADSAGEAA